MSYGSLGGSHFGSRTLQRVLDRTGMSREEATKRLVEVDRAREAARTGGGGGAPVAAAGGGMSTYLMLGGAALVLLFVLKKRKRK